MSGIDRLAEFNITVDDDDAPAEEAKDAEFGNHMKMYEPIKQGLDLIVSNVATIDGLKEKDRTLAKEKDRKAIMDELNGIMDKTTRTGQRIKEALDNIKREDQKQKDQDSAKAQMRVNLYQTHIRRFAKVMNDYNAASHEFKKNLQERTRRQLKIVSKDISDEQVEKIVASGQAAAFIQDIWKSENIEDAVRDIEERHLDILKLETQVMEVYELFKDLATLVEIQQESLDVIETRIANAKDFAGSAEGELKTAEEYQKKARNKRCCILFILLAILIAIIAPILSSTLSDS